MSNNHRDVVIPEEIVQTQEMIQDEIVRLFIPEESHLRAILSTAREAGVRPEMQISPIQGKLLQLLAALCHAQRILEIGTLAGYSGIWLAQALPSHGQLITLEIDAALADMARQAFEKAGVSDRSEVRVGDALSLLPQLTREAPFDLIFIDANKAAYPRYLTWALKLSRPGSIIVADNCIHKGRALQENPEQDADTAGLYHYNQQVLSNTRLLSLALPLEDHLTDGFTISVVR